MPHPEQTRNPRNCRIVSIRPKQLDTQPAEQPRLEELCRRHIEHLDDGRIEGTDPLFVFGPNTADHLRRTSTFHNCPDLLVNSFYDPDADEGAAFEELIGFHGGLGGRQSQPFVLAPASLAQPTAPLVGARAIHDLFATWLGDVQGRIADEDRVPTGQ